MYTCYAPIGSKRKVLGLQRFADLGHPLFPSRQRTWHRSPTELLDPLRRSGRTKARPAAMRRPRVRSVQLDVGADPREES